MCSKVVAISLIKVSTLVLYYPVVKANLLSMTSKAPKTFQLASLIGHPSSIYPSAEVGCSHFLDGAHFGFGDLCAVFCSPRVPFTCLIQDNLAGPSLLVYGAVHRGAHSQRPTSFTSHYSTSLSSTLTTKLSRAQDQVCNSISTEEMN